MDLHLYNLLNNLLTFLMVILFILGFVTIVMWFKKKEGERKTNLLLSALEKGQTIDPELFRSGKQSKSVNQYVLLALLVCGTGISLFAVVFFSIAIIECISRGHLIQGDIMGGACFIAIGASLLIGYFKGKKMLKD
ncbi:MAG: DUF6249 domain-containing protein [Bacteroidales bacterium]|nr:DUF6249 domain-containing protein [Bacteroidales bacterium]